ncbi:MAG: hypothetical protein AAF587_32055 [Bacteroidota bacterium]
MNIHHLLQLIVITACQSIPNSPDYVHAYPSYWDKYSQQEFIDSLYADTLLIGPDSDGAWSSRTFYVESTDMLVSDINKQWQRPDQLYPAKSFDRVRMKVIPFGPTRQLSKAHISTLLSLINDPLNFDWAETTFSKEIEVEFWDDDKLVSSFMIGARQTVIKPIPDWPHVKSMKFGHLTHQSTIELQRLLQELNL